METEKNQKRCESDGEVMLLDKINIIHGSNGKVQFWVYKCPKCNGDRVVTVLI